MKKAIPQILGDMSELNSHDGLKTGLLQFFCRNPKKRKFYRGNLREYRGNLREYRGNLQTDVSTILKPTFQACVAMAQEFQEPSSLFFFHGTNSPNPWCPDLSKNEAVGAAIGQNHLSHFYCFIAVFVFHRVFSNQNGPSRFFLAFGFCR